MEEISHTPGYSALGIGILSAVGAVLSLALSVAAGFGSTVCGAICPLACVMGPVASLVPVLAGLLALIGALWGVVVMRKESAGPDDNNRKYAMVGAGLCVPSLLLNIVSFVVANGGMIVGLIVGGAAMIAEMVG